MRTARNYFRREPSVLAAWGVLAVIVAIWLTGTSLNVLSVTIMISQKVPLRIALVPEFLLGLCVVLTLGSALTAYVVARLKIRQGIADTLRHGL